MGKDKAVVAPMSRPFGVELNVSGSPDHENGNSKKSMNRRGFGLGGVLNITGIENESSPQQPPIVCAGAHLVLGKGHCDM